MLTENSKSEERSTKQIRNSNSPMFETKSNKSMAWKFWSLGFGKFEFVSDFDIRISDLFLYCDLSAFWGQISRPPRI
jgi:hypothetical protein